MSIRTGAAQRRYDAGPQSDEGHNSFDYTPPTTAIDTVAAPADTATNDAQTADDHTPATMAETGRSDSLGSVAQLLAKRNTMESLPSVSSADELPRSRFSDPVFAVRTDSLAAAARMSAAAAAAGKRSGPQPQPPPAAQHVQQQHVASPVRVGCCCSYCGGRIASGAHMRPRSAHSTSSSQSQQQQSPYGNDSAAVPSARGPTAQHSDRRATVSSGGSCSRRAVCLTQCRQRCAEVGSSAVDGQARSPSPSLCLFSTSPRRCSCSKTQVCRRHVCRVRRRCMLCRCRRARAAVAGSDACARARTRSSRRVCGSTATPARRHCYNT